MRRIAIVGGHGQLGTALSDRLGERSLTWSHADFDLTWDEAAMRERLRSAGCEAVVNAAAYNKVDLAESDPAPAFEINARGPGRLARACEDLGLPLVHVSTDYVYGADIARSTPYRETDPAGPLSQYGRSKLDGEREVAAHCRRHFVVRTCGLYGRATSTQKRNFVETMRLLSQKQPSVRVVADQHNTPTYADDLAEALIGLMATEAYGLYHATNAGETTWADFARTIFSLTNTPTEVTPIATADYNAAAPRPCYSVLDGGKLSSVLGRSLPTWEDALGRYLRTLG